MAERSKSTMLLNPNQPTFWEQVDYGPEKVD